ncbi:MAG TPA: P-loop NTPase fold protein [Tepidisphaeraceae bacterium]|jgi:hypothetical protein|nr:P-loop NTPase fold protein [Tepidisphaeraceae bacterium]
MTDLDALMEYFRQSSTDYAYMITGPWGCGKSYFWNRVAMPAIAKDSTWDVEHKPIPIYISLYGIKDLDEISRSVLLQIHPKLGITGKAISVLGRGIAQYFNLDELAEKIDVVQWLEPLAKKKNLIICFDDLERAPRPVSRVLGFINQYVEQLGMKTVILCNEQEIFDRKGGESYRKTGLAHEWWTRGIYPVRAASNVSGLT